MAKIDQLLEQYGASHQNATNKLIHWVCVPLIVFSLMGMLMAIPFPVEKTVFFNWAAVFILGGLIYYLRLSIPMFLGFILIMGLILFGNYAIYESLAFQNGTMALVSLGIFAAAWVGQFIGHKIEGAKPSFLEDVQFLMIGPAWLLHFIYKKVGIRYS